MFDSGITAKTLIDEIINEDDVNSVVSESFYYMLYSRLITLLYTEVIKTQGEFTVENPAFPVDIDYKPENCEYVRFCDIAKVYAYDDNLESHELEPCTIADGESFMRNCYFETDGKIGIRCDYPVRKIKVVFLRVPANLYRAFVEDNYYNDINIPLPIEFLPLVSSYLRSEKYRFDNSDTMCSKWAENYNSHLSDFKNWVALRNGKNKMKAG